MKKWTVISIFFLVIFIFMLGREMDFDLRWRIGFLLICFIAGATYAMMEWPKLLKQGVRKSLIELTGLIRRKPQKGEGLKCN